MSDININNLSLNEVKEQIAQGKITAEDLAGTLFEDLEQNGSVSAKITDKNGDSAKIEISNSGKVVLTTDTGTNSSVQYVKIKGTSSKAQTSNSSSPQNGSNTTTETLKDGSTVSTQINNDGSATVTTTATDGTVTTQEYNSSGLLTGESVKSTVQDAAGKDVEQNVVTIYEYNESGQLIKSSKSGQYALSDLGFSACGVNCDYDTNQTYTYTYDDSGLLESCEITYTNSGEVYQYINYEHDENGNLIAAGILQPTDSDYIGGATRETYDDGTTDADIINQPAKFNSSGTNSDSGSQTVSESIFKEFFSNFLNKLFGLIGSGKNAE